MGDPTKRPKKPVKPAGVPQSSTAKSSAAKSAIYATTKKTRKGFRGQTLKPIDEKYVIGSAAPLPFNDLSNDSFLIKAKTIEPVT